MNKLYILFGLVFLTACGDSAPPAWDGKWAGVEDGVDNLNLVFNTPDSTEPDKKIVTMFENGKMADICIVENALVNEVIMICKEDPEELFSLTHNGESFNLAVDGEKFTFVRTE